MSDRVIDESLDSIGETRRVDELEIERCCPVEKSHPRSENGRVDQELKLVDQTESDKALRKGCATVGEEILPRLGLQIGDLPR